MATIAAAILQNPKLRSNAEEDVMEEVTDEFPGVQFPDHVIFGQDADAPFQNGLGLLQILFVTVRAVSSLSAADFL